MSGDLQIHNYLIFDGQAKEALEFYGKAFEAKVEISFFSDMPGAEADPAHKDRVMHGGIHFDNGTPYLMASDTFPGSPEKYVQGNNYSVSITSTDVDLLEKRFNAVAEGGVMKMPLAETFWATRFGIVVDKFGVQWMFNCHKPTETSQAN